MAGEINIISDSYVLICNYTVKAYVFSCAGVLKHNGITDNCSLANSYAAEEHGVDNCTFDYTTISDNRVLNNCAFNVLCRSGVTNLCIYGVILLVEKRDGICVGVRELFRVCLGVQKLFHLTVLGFCFLTGVQIFPGVIGTAKGFKA